MGIQQVWGWDVLASVPRPSCSCDHPPRQLSTKHWQHNGEYRHGHRFHLVHEEAEEQQRDEPRPWHGTQGLLCEQRDNNGWGKGGLKLEQQSGPRDYGFSHEGR